MAYDTKADLEVRLAEIRLEIAKARKAQSYGIGSNEVTVTRGNLKSLLEEERWVLAQIKSIDAESAGGACNRIQFGRPC